MLKPFKPRRAPGEPSYLRCRVRFSSGVVREMDLREEFAKPNLRLVMRLKEDSPTLGPAGTTISVDVIEVVRWV